MIDAIGSWIESDFALIIDDFLNGGIAWHHFFFDFVIAQSESFE